MAIREESTPVHVRRSWYFVEGANDEALSSAVASGADVLIQELEDFTPPARRPHARTISPEVIGRWKAAGIVAAVRVNPLDDGGLDDLAAVMQGPARRHPATESQRRRPDPGARCRGHRSGRTKRWHRGFYGAGTQRRARPRAAEHLLQTTHWWRCQSISTHADSWSAPKSWVLFRFAQPVTAQRMPVPP